MAKRMESKQSFIADILQVVVFGGLFAVVLLPLVVWNGSFFPFITGKNFLFRIIVEIMFASWVLLALYDARYRPQWSWIVASFAALLAIMATANALGEYPLKSFWSNFERMDGYVTLVHVFMYMLVAGTVMQSLVLWRRLLHTSIVVAVLVALYGLGQQAGWFEGGRGSRVDSRLGNAAYMAVYMLFHSFFIFFLMLQTRVRWQWVLYAVTAALMVYTMLQTGTRGTFLGLAGGAVVTVVYIALFARRTPELRRYAVGGVFLLVIAGLLFVGLRESTVVQSNPSLKRIANIDLQEDLQVRTVIWGLAWEGVKERPILGWGQGNFNYVFNEQYDPFLFDQEQWFDRVHNIFFDWLIAGGFLGAAAYFGIILAMVYYLFVVPVLLRRESPFSVPEQAVLLGLVVAYLLHNMVVFDNIISYIFFAVLLGLIHQRVSRPIPALTAYQIPRHWWSSAAVPAVMVGILMVVYLVNWQAMLASRDIIYAMRANTIEGRLEHFHNALARDSFARQEIVEQLTQNAMTAVRTPELSESSKNLIVQRAELELLRLAEDKPNDARVHNFIASFYRTIGAIDEAREQIAIAAALSPRKPALRMEQGLVELQAADLEAAEAFFRQALALDERNTQARIFLASTLFRQGENEDAIALISDEHKAAFAASDYGVSSVEASGAFDYLAELYEERVTQEPEVAQNWASLAFIYIQQDDTEQAVDALERASVAIPNFATQASCYIENIKTGNDPADGC